MGVQELVDQAAYRESARTKYDLVQVINNFTNLQPKLSTYIHNDGSESQQVVLEGTIPIVYQGATYNIPMDIFIMLQHPVEVPKCYVRPTSNMMIKPGHSFVNADGLVSTEHVLTMTGSSAQQYNLTDFLFAMSQLFGNEPPLFTKPKPRVNAGSGGGGDYTQSATARTPVAQPRGDNRMRINPPFPSSGSSGRSSQSQSDGQPLHALGARPPASACSSGTQGCGGMASTTTCGLCYMAAMAEQPPPPEKTNSGASASLVNSAKSNYSSDAEGSSSATHASSVDTAKFATPRKEMEMLLTEKLQIALVSNFSKKRDDLELAMQGEEAMKGASTALDAQFKELEAMKRDLTAGLESISAKAGALEALKADEHRKEVKLEDRLVPHDSLSSQVVKLTAEQAAIEDCIYYLERALASASNPSVEISEFLFHTRKMSRDLFIRKHHLNKIAKVLARGEAGLGTGKEKEKDGS